MDDAADHQSRAFFVTVLVLALLVVGYIFLPFLTALVLAVFTASLVMPMQRWLSRHMPTRLAATIVVLAVVLIVAAPVAVLGILLFDDAQEAAAALDDGGIRQRFDELVRPYLDGEREEQNATLDATWDRMVGKAQDLAESAAAKAPTFLIDVAIGTGVLVFALFFLLVDADRLIAYVKDALPMPEAQTRFLLQQADETIHAIFFGQIVTGVVQGVVGGIGFWIAGLPSLILWTFAMAILSILPVIGAFLVWVPAVIYLFVAGELWQAIFLLLWGLIPVSFTDEFLRPYLISGRSGLHPVLMLLAILGGVKAVGAVGLILGPLMVGVTVALLRVWRKSHKEDGIDSAE